jgi:hypothetical protein
MRKENCNSKGHKSERDEENNNRSERKKGRLLFYVVSFKLVGD